MISNRYYPGDTYSQVKNNVASNFLIINFLTLNILGLIFFFFVEKNKIIKSYLFIFISSLLFTGILTYISNAMPTHNPWRIAVIWSILLLPLTAYLIHFLWTSPEFVFKLSSILLLILIAIISILKILEFSKFSYLRKEDLITGSYIADSLLVKDVNTQIFIQENNWEYTNLLISTGMPERFLTDKKLFGELAIDTIPYFDKRLDYLKHQNIKYIILKPYNADYFNLNQLKELKAFNNWVIYSFK